MISTNFSSTARKSPWRSFRSDTAVEKRSRMTAGGVSVDQPISFNLLDLFIQFSAFLVQVREPVVRIVGGFHHHVSQRLDDQLKPRLRSHEAEALIEDPIEEVQHILGVRRQTRTLDPCDSPRGAAATSGFRQSTSRSDTFPADPEAPPHALQPSLLDTSPTVTAGRCGPTLNWPESLKWRLRKSMMYGALGDRSSRNAGEVSK